MAAKPDEMRKSQHPEEEADSIAIAPGPDVVSLDNVDQALAAKMNLVNEVRVIPPSLSMISLTHVGN